MLADSFIPSLYLALSRCRGLWLVLASFGAKQWLVRCLAGTRGRPQGSLGTASTNTSGLAVSYGRTKNPRLDEQLGNQAGSSPRHGRLSIPGINYLKNTDLRSCAKDCSLAACELSLAVFGETCRSSDFVELGEGSPSVMWRKSSRWPKAATGIYPLIDNIERVRT